MKHKKHEAQYTLRLCNICGSQITRIPGSHIPHHCLACYIMVKDYERKK